MDTSALKVSLLKNYFSFSVGVWGNAIISFLTVPIISWLIAPVEFGKAMMFSTVYSILSMIVTLGIPGGVMRLYHQIKEKEKLLWSSLIVPLILTTFTAILVLIFKEHVNQLLVGEQEASAHTILILTLFLGVMQSFNQTIIRMQGRGLAYSTLQLLSAISNVGFAILYAVIVQRNFYALLYAQLFSTGVALTAGVYLQKEKWFPVKIDKTLVKELLTFSYPFLLSGILWWVLGWTDRVFLRIFSDFNDVGLYSAAFKLVSVINLFKAGFETFWPPFAYEQYEKNQNSLTVFRKTFDYIAFSIFSVAFVLLSTKDLIFLLFEKSYRTATYIAPFLLLSPISMTMNCVSARGIDFTKKTYWVIVSDGVGAIFNFIFNLSVVPLLGAKGAALTTGLSYIIVFAIETTISEKLYRVGYKLKKAFLMLTVYTLIAALNTFVQNRIIGVLSALLGFVALLMVYKDVFYDTIRFFCELLTMVRFKMRKKL